MCLSRTGSMMVARSMSGGLESRVLVLRILGAASQVQGEAVD